ncbi:MAG: hypothetical protein AB7I19_09835 [Planctomycetota bacterium]
MTRNRIARRTPFATVGVALSGSLLLTACLSPGSAPSIRYFLPAGSVTAAGDSTSDPVDAPIAEVGLELANLRSDAHIDERMLLRSSDVEVFPDEQNRWISRPSVFVEQSLRQALFGERGFAERSGEAKLRVTLRAYEATLTEPAAAVVAWECVLDQAGKAHNTLLRESVGLSDTRPESIARGMAIAQENCAQATLAWARRIIAPEK